MRLSVDRINEESPYWVLQIDDMQFRFRTKNGITYHVGFYPECEKIVKAFDEFTAKVPEILLFGEK